MPATGITRICPQKPWLTQGYAGMAAALPIVTAGGRFKSQGKERDLKKKRKLMGINLRLCKAVKPGEQAGGFLTRITHTRRNTRHGYLERTLQVRADRFAAAVTFKQFGL